MLPRLRRAPWLGGALLLALAALPSAAQERGADDPHAHCKTKPAAEATKSTARPMPAQPAIGEIALVDQDGRETTLRDALEAEVPVLVNFIFTTCTTICPVMTATFAKVDDTLGNANEDALLVSISIDPERDTPARLREYAKRFDAGPNWRFLTGTPAQSEAAQRAFGAATASKFNHAPLTFLRAPDASRWVRLEGLGGAEAIVAEYRRIVPEGSRIASLEKQ